MWIALVPFFLALDGKRKRSGFGLGCLCGFVFFFFLIFWMHHVTAFGMVLSAVILSLYFGFFGICYTVFQRTNGLLRLFLIPSIWSVLEYARATISIGFDWGSLGYSQYLNLVMIQVADMIGMVGISFVIVLVNVCIKEMVVGLLMRDKTTRDGLPKIMVLTFLIVGIVFIYGMIKLNANDQYDSLRVGVVQGNIAQEMKWNEELWPEITQLYMRMSEDVAKENPDLIIWPETSFPGFLWEHNEHIKHVQEFVDKLDYPLLFGTIADDDGVYHNSAVFVSKDGEIVGKYDKLHLVIFGEYLPFRTVFPFLENIVPIADFTSGTEYTVFHLDEEESGGRTFSAFICFEDTISRLSRGFVANGAQLLINITNDAWFGDTKAPFLHLQSSVLRAVENRRSIVRSTNTGVSAFIDLNGRILRYVQDNEGKKTFIKGATVESVPLNQKLTFYTRFGNVFAYFCFVCILWGVWDLSFPRTGCVKSLN